jgi:cobalamin biosynthesis protein CbiD
MIICAGCGTASFVISALSARIDHTLIFGGIGVLFLLAGGIFLDLHDKLNRLSKF